MKKILCITFLFAFVSCNNGPENPVTPQGTKTDGPKLFTTSIVNTFPHDTSSYTEGLQIYNGDLYESTGNYGLSKLLKLDLKTGKVLKSLTLPETYFGEGICILRDTIYQWTYKEHKLFMYSLKDYKKLKEISYDIPAEGWGMTTDGKDIIASGGTNNLYFYEPGTFRLLRTLAITENGLMSYNINELEYIDGFIYANQWQTPYILKIDPATGVIVAKTDLTDLVNRIHVKYPEADVLNGIAYDAATKKIYITGKKWPELYEVQFGN